MNLLVIILGLFFCVSVTLSDELREYTFFRNDIIIFMVINVSLRSWLHFFLNSYGKNLQTIIISKKNIYNYDLLG